MRVRRAAAGPQATPHPPLTIVPSTGRQEGARRIRRSAGSRNKEEDRPPTLTPQAAHRTADAISCGSGQAADRAARRGLARGEPQPRGAAWRRSEDSLARPMQRLQGRCIGWVCSRKCRSLLSSPNEDTQRGKSVRVLSSFAVLAERGHAERGEYVFVLSSRRASIQLAERAALAERGT
jgi:hypothetical protein